MSSGDAGEDMLQIMRKKNVVNALRAMEEFQKDPQKKTSLPVLSMQKELEPAVKKRIRVSKLRSETPTQIRTGAHRELLQRQSREIRRHVSAEQAAPDFRTPQPPSFQSSGDSKDEQSLVLQLLDLQTQIKNSGPAIGDFLSGSGGADSFFEHELRTCALFLRQHNELLREYLSPTQQANPPPVMIESDAVAALDTNLEDEHEKLSGVSVPISQMAMGRAQRKRREADLIEQLNEAQILRNRAVDIVNRGGIRLFAQRNVDLEKTLRPEERRTLLILAPILRSTIAGRASITKGTGEATEGLQELANMRCDF